MSSSPLTPTIAMATDAFIDPSLLQQLASMPENTPKCQLSDGNLNTTKKKKQKRCVFYSERSFTDKSFQDHDQAAVVRAGGQKGRLSV